MTTNTNNRTIQFGMTQVEFVDIAGYAADSQSKFVNNTIKVLVKIARLTGKGLSIKIIPANDRVMVKYKYSGEVNEYYEIPEDMFKDRIFELSRVEPEELTQSEWKTV